LTGKGDLSGSEAKHSLEFGFDFIQKEYASINLKFITPYPFETKYFELYTAAVGYYQGVSVGTEVQLFPSKPGVEVSKATGYLQYDKQNFSTALFAKFERKDEDTSTTKLGVGHYHDVNKNLKVGGELSFDPKKPSDATIKVSGVDTLDDQSSLKPRFTFTTSNSELRFSLVFKQTISSTTKLTLSTDISTNPLFQKDIKDVFKNNQFGVTLSFFD